MNKPQNNGFTLIELIIVIALISFLLVGIMSSYVQIQKLLNSQSRAAYQGQQAEELYAILSHDIQNMVYEKWNQKYFFNARKEITGGKRMDFFNFISGSIYSNPQLFQSRVYSVTYYGDTDKDSGGNTLYRKEDLMVDYKHSSYGTPIPVLRNMNEFRIEFSRNGNDWLETWDYSIIKTIPEYIRITIQYVQDEGSANSERTMVIQTSPGIIM